MEKYSTKYNKCRNLKYDLIKCSTNNFTNSICKDKYNKYKHMCTVDYDRMQNFQYSKLRVFDPTYGKIE